MVIAWRIHLSPAYPSMIGYSAHTRRMDGMTMSHRVVELHCIMPIANIPSVMAHGILCHDQAAQVAHASVAMQEIQDVRDNKSVPGGLKLHQYANLYFCARNPMMFKRKDNHADICVIRVSIDVMNRPRVVLSDQNAASTYARFHSYPTGLQSINFDYVYADSWQDEDQVRQWQKKSAKCAEVLVPGNVPPNYITGFYVSGAVGAQRLAVALNGNYQLPSVNNPQLFFR